MDKKKLNLLDDNSLKSVSGGLEVGKDTGDGFTGESIPFCCPSCNTVIWIKPGQKYVMCINPKCRKKYNIDV